MRLVCAQARRGIGRALHRLGSKVVLLGKDNKLYCWENETLQEVMYNSQAWELKATRKEDVSMVQVAGNTTEAGVRLLLA